MGVYNVGFWILSNKEPNLNYSTIRIIECLILNIGLIRETSKMMGVVFYLVKNYLNSDNFSLIGRVFV